MIEIRQILCPVDFSDTSRRALRHAAATARWYGSRLTVLHVIRYTADMGVLPVLSAPTADRFGLDEEARQKLTEGAWSFVHDAIGSDVPLELLVTDALSVHAEIAEQARLQRADLLVLGTHGRSGYDRLMLGSITEKVIRHPQVPVMVVPLHGRNPVAAGDVAFDRIICGVDFSESSLSALTYAMSLAEEADAQLTVAGVIEVFPEPAEMWDSTGVAVAQARAADRAATLTRLRRLIPDSVRTYCRVDTVAEEGKPYKAILRLAEERESDLIVIGTQSRTGPGRWLIGSNANHILRSAPCPVLTVPDRPVLGAQS